VVNDPFRALSHPIRRGIVERLAAGSTTVGDATGGFGVSKPAISKHLKVLEETGVVARVVEGRTHRLSLEPVVLDAATFALIIYYALAGLALIFAGRFRRVGLWRAAGLALAFYAGYKALVETFTIDAVGLRVGARILVGVFLAAVAYWYRVPQGPPADIASPAAPPAGTEPATEAL